MNARRSVFVLSLSLSAGAADAGFVNPLMPDWHGATNTSFVGWESFSSASGAPNLPNFPGTAANGVLFNFGPGAIITSTGNMYGYAGPLFIAAFGSTLDYQSPIEVVLNVSTAGTLINSSSVSLTFNDNLGHSATVAPAFTEVRYDEPMPPPGGSVQNVAFGFSTSNLEFAATNWRLDFSSISANMSLDAVTLDFRNVPAPGVVAMLGIAAIAGNRRRR